LLWLRILVYEFRQSVLTYIMAPSSDEIDKVYYPDMSLAQKRNSLLLGTAPDREKLKAAVLAQVTEQSMLPYYEKYLCPDVLGAVDEALKAKMQKANDEELKKIEEKIQDATENFGDIEVRDAMLAKADFYNRIGDKDAAIAGYKEAFGKTIGTGGKLDNIMTVIRIAFFYEDKELVKTEIEKAKAELKKGGDWERRNRLKVYEGMYFIGQRQWKEAATLFLNVMPTFTATELVEFKDFVKYTVIITMVACDRATIRKSLVSSPEVLSAIKETPHLQEFLDAYFGCNYQPFMEHFVHAIDIVKEDRYLALHSRYFMRAMRLNAYRQFLASYRSVQIAEMAKEFGVSDTFIDSELSSFISSGKLSCKIDKVKGVVESNETDSRSQVYVEIIKQGDLLLNRMQKLSGAIDM